MLFDVVGQRRIELPAPDAPGHILGLDPQPVGELHPVLFVGEPDEDADDPSRRSDVDAGQLSGSEGRRAAKDWTARRAIGAVGHMKEVLVRLDLVGKPAAQRTPDIDVRIERAAAALAFLVGAEAVAAMRGEAGACGHGVGLVEAEPPVLLARWRLARTRRGDLAKGDVEVRGVGLVLLVMVGLHVAHGVALAVACLELEAAGLALTAARGRHQGAVVDQERRADATAAAVAVGPFAGCCERIGLGDLDASWSAELLGVDSRRQGDRQEGNQSGAGTQHDVRLVQRQAWLPLG